MAETDVLEIRRVPDDAGAAPQTPAVKRQLFVERGGRRFEVASLEDASQRWQEFTSRAMKAGATGADLGSQTRVVDQDGKEVGRISQNGKVWPPGEWTPEMQPLVGEKFKPGTAPAPPAIESAAKAEPAASDAGGFDPDKFDRDRAGRVKASREAGNVHLDKVPAYVETMRGKEIAYVHDTKVRGTIRTVDNRGNVHVNWNDAYSADKEMAVEVQDGMRKVMRSSLGPTDLKDYFVANVDCAPAERVDALTPGTPETLTPEQFRALPEDARNASRDLARIDREVAGIAASRPLSPISVIAQIERLGRLTEFKRALLAAGATQAGADLVNKTLSASTPAAAPDQPPSPTKVTKRKGPRP